MKPFTSTVSLLVCLFVACWGVAADKPLVIDIWLGKPADDDAGTIGEEKFFQLQVKGKPHEVGGKPTKWLTNVTKPTLTVYRPAKDKDTGTAVLICPGGGYHNLGWDVEGEEVAEWLNSIGATGIILKYRCPRRPGDVKGEPPLGPLKDAQRAVSLVRSKAREWGIDPQRIGMVGFSAGGHLTLATTTNFDRRTYKPIDAIDQVSCRPDFAVPVYSGYLKHREKDEPAPGIRVPAGTPPIFLVHASDDPISTVEHSVTMYTTLKRAGIPTEMHIYASGGHGFGVRPVGHPCAAWTRSCADWLRSQGMLEQGKDRPATGAAAGQNAAPPRRIFVAGGGILGGGPDHLLLRYMLSLTGKPEPVVCCLPTARGDNLENLAVWYEIMNALPCRPRHLRLFGPTKDLRDFEKQLLSADVIFVPGGNTLNMLAVWKAQGVDVILRRAGNGASCSPGKAPEWFAGSSRR